MTHVPFITVISRYLLDYNKTSLGAKWDFQNPANNDFLLDKCDKGYLDHVIKYFSPIKSITKHTEEKCACVWN